MAQENTVRNDDFYTFEDYLHWCGDDRIEIIDGVPYMMAEPSTEHQSISWALAGQLYLFLRDKPCRGYTAPFSVRPLENKSTHPMDVNTVVEPDISVVCDSSKIDNRGCHGAPDFIIEILSPSTAKHDQFRKFNLYQMAGVREYWIVDPETKTVQPYVLKDGRYMAGEPSGGALASAVLDGFTADLRAVFEE